MTAEWPVVEPSIAVGDGFCLSTVRKNLPIDKANDQQA